MIAIVLAQTAIGCSGPKTVGYHEMPSASYALAGELSDTVADSNRLAGRYALTYESASGVEFCELLLEPDDGDDFIGFQGIWFGKNCHRTFQVLDDVIGWGPGDRDIRLHASREFSMLPPLIFSPEHNARSEMRYSAVIEGTTYRLLKLEDYDRFR